MAAALIGLIAFGQRLGLVQLTGVALVLLSVAIISVGPRPAAADPARPARP